MISGQENYTRAIDFRSPSYLPVRILCDLDWLYEKDEAKVARIHELQTRFPEDLLVIPEGWKRTNTSEDRWIDEWNVGWVLALGKSPRIETHPLKDGYQLLDDYAFPDPDAPGRFDEADRDLEHRGNRYCMGKVWNTLFERLWSLRGFENMLMDPYIETENFIKLRDRVVEINMTLIGKWIERKVDGVFFSDDWGGQKSLLMRPDDWRKFYKPYYRKMFQPLRDNGIHVWLHACGNVSAIIPDLIEVGVNVLNPVQPQAMDVNWLSEEFGGKICFCGGIDVQGTMVKGTPEDVKAEVHKTVGLFGGFNGGYIGATSHTIMPETPLDNVIALYETFLEYTP